MTGIIGHARITGPVYDAGPVLDLATRAAERAIDSVHDRFDIDYRPYAVWFVHDAVLTPGETVAGRIHSRLGLAPFVGAYDMCGSARSAVGALKIASTSTMLAVLVQGDTASAFCFGKGDALADEVAGANITDVDDPTGLTSVAEALAGALGSAGIATDDLALALVSGADPAALADATGIESGRVRTGAGTGRLLSDALGDAAPGSIIAQIVGCDGVDVRLWRLGGGAAPA